MTAPGTAVALLVAAGSGERLGADVPKAFVRLGNEPLLVHAARALWRTGRFSELVVVVPEGFQDEALSRLLSAGLPDPTVCTGAGSRQGSVARGLDCCPPDAAVIAVHDAARPLPPADLVARVLDAVDGGWDAAAPGIPVTDTIKRVDPDGCVQETLERGALRAVQTPQAFRADVLRRAHASGDADGATDDLALVERLGIPALLVDGDSRNLKVTGPADLRMAERLLVEGVR